MPEAMVETIIFGVPRGSILMPEVMMDVPPEPPRPMTPPRSSLAGRKAARASPMAPTASPRSLADERKPGFEGWHAATSAAVTSTGFPWGFVPTSTRTVPTPFPAMMSRTKASSSYFVSQVPTI